ncbi:hypothetical protein [Pseudomonas chlororaphis]|uniref:hypothetical protein n=1 Tax=Pseudomonas chlororaphis TaxID=587753 RepID=UPI000F589023|nr:hypothetical protein [Pseudomonas chlororaphis]AZD54098.1 hypothetical protein C4K19_2311 [Pseudomonas chlororaphis subsp. aurantiaca]
MKKRIASVLVGIFLLSVCTLLALYWPTGIEANIRHEIGKSALQLLVVSVIGTIISLLVFEYQRERQTIDRNAEQARQASEKKRDQQQKHFEYRESLLISALSRTANAYSRAKKARRVTRAHMTLTGTTRQLSLAQYDSFFDLINEAQLDLENLKRDIRTIAKTLSAPENLIEKLNTMDSYLGELITEYEDSRQKFIGTLPTLPLSDFPLLDNYVRPANSSFMSAMVTPYSEIQATIRSDLLHPNLP